MCAILTIPSLIRSCEMAYTLQIHGERRVYPIPNGLYELVSDIAREVLRSQPQDILKFIADYCDALLDTKALAGEAVKVVDEVLQGGEESINLCLGLGVSLEEANRAASIIQAAFHGYIERKRQSASSGGGKKQGPCFPESTRYRKFQKKLESEPEKTPMMIQEIESTLKDVKINRFNKSVERSHLFNDLLKQITKSIKHDLSLVKPVVKPAKETLIDTYLEEKEISFLQASRAATVIQAWWRGYCVRKRLNLVRKHGPADLSQESWSHEWLWQDFQVTPSDDKNVLYYKDILMVDKKKKTQYLPRRSITINHHKLKTLFRGHKEDYEQLERSALSLVSSKDTLENVAIEREHPSDINFRRKEEMVAESQEVIEPVRSEMSIAESEEIKKESPRDTKIESGLDKSPEILEPAEMTETDLEEETEGEDELEDALTEEMAEHLEMTEEGSIVLEEGETTEAEAEQDEDEIEPTFDQSTRPSLTIGESSILQEKLSPEVEEGSRFQFGTTEESEVESEAELTELQDDSEIATETEGELSEEY